MEILRKKNKLCISKSFYGPIVSVIVYLTLSSQASIHGDSWNHSIRKDSTTRNYNLNSYNIIKKYGVIHTAHGEKKYFTLAYELKEPETIDTCLIYSAELSRGRHVYEMSAIGNGYVSVVDSMIGDFSYHTLLSPSGVVIFDREEGYNYFLFVNNDIIQAFQIERYDAFYNINTYHKIKRYDRLNDQFCEIEGFDNSFYSRYIVWDAKFHIGLIDSNFRIVINAEYKNLRFPHENMCAVQDFTDHWGFYSLIDDSLLIPCIYTEVGDFSGGKAFVKNNKSKWGCVNKYNEPLSPFVYSSLSEIIKVYHGEETIE